MSYSKNKLSREFWDTLYMNNTVYILVLVEIETEKNNAITESTAFALLCGRSDGAETSSQGNIH